jgi:Sterol-sensing domain of SREBP cleavage-activation
LQPLLESNGRSFGPGNHDLCGQCRNVRRIGAFLLLQKLGTSYTYLLLTKNSHLITQNISDIAAINESARVAQFAVISLYIAVIFCFPAYCYVDLRRQAQNKRDFFLGTRQGAATAEVAKPTDDVVPEKGSDWRSVILYDKFYMLLVLGPGTAHRRSYLIIWAITAALLGGSAYGLTQIKVGLGLEEFFPNDNPAFVWATTRTKDLASWNIGMRWGALSYEDPVTQMKMIRQFEQVTESSKVSQTDTDQLWMASFLTWSSRLCESNLVRKDFEQRQCGYDKIFSDGSVCSATWTENTLDLRNYFLAEPDDPKCYNFAGGICRKGKNMHPEDLVELQADPVLNQDQSYCPVIEGWPAEKWQFCLKEWRTITGVDAGFVLQQKKGTPKECSGEFETNEDIVWPIPISASPLMYAFDLFAHEDTLDLMDETRTFCDDDEETHCWLTGIPYDYWTQYEYIYETLLQCGGYSGVVGFLISFCFLFVSALSQGRHSFSKVCVSSLIGSFLIFLTIALSFIVVVGLSLCVGVSLTGFSNMSFVLS